MQLRSGERSGKVDGEGGSNVPSPSSKVAWGRYRRFPRCSRRRIPCWTRLCSRVIAGPVRCVAAALVRAGCTRRASSRSACPRRINWGMLRDFARVLADPEYVELQVSDGLRPRADVQRAINAAAAAAATLNQTIDLEDDEDAPGDELIVALIDDKEVVQKAPSFSLIPGVAGVVRAKLDPLRSARRAYEYIHGVGWVLEMYYTGACLDYGYHFQYSPREHNQGIAAAIDKKALDANSFTAGTTAFKANKSRNTTDVAAAAAAAAAANAAASQGSGGSGSGGALAQQGTPRPRWTSPNFLTLPLTYDPTLDPLRDRERAGVAYLNRYPITASRVFPRGDPEGRSRHAGEGRAATPRPGFPSASPFQGRLLRDHVSSIASRRVLWSASFSRSLETEGGGSMGTASAKGKRNRRRRDGPRPRGVAWARGARGGWGTRQKRCVLRALSAYLRVSLRAVTKRFDPRLARAADVCARGSPSAESSTPRAPLEGAAARSGSTSSSAQRPRGRGRARLR